MNKELLHSCKRFAFVVASVLFSLCAHAQIGYQISLLNTATGEPRANETVNVTATITDSAGGVIYTGTQSVTSNDFGVLSLTVGNADTFSTLNLQEHRLPFFIEVSANGAMIGKSQILSVPVAEVAKQLEPLKLEDVVGTWVIGEGGDEYCSVTFNSDMTAQQNFGSYIYQGNFFIDGKNIIFYWVESYDNHSQVFIVYRIIDGKLYENW